MNYSFWQNKMAKKPSLSHSIFALQVCGVQTAALFTGFVAQNTDKSMETPVSTMALLSGHLIKRRDMLFTSPSYSSLIY
jgi:hypothetical protein